VRAVLAARDVAAEPRGTAAQMIERAERGELAPFGMHIQMGETAPQKMRNAARNIEESRTHPVQVICRKPQ
jgi:hypothetical protein